MPEPQPAFLRMFRRPIEDSLRFAVRGLLAGLLVALLDLLFFRHALIEQFPSRLLQLRLVGHVAATSMVALLPLGVLMGWLDRLSARWLSNHRPAFVGMLWALVLSPLMVWISFSLFLGGKMQRIAHHDLLSLLLVLLSLISIQFLAPRAVRSWHTLHAQSLRSRLLAALVFATLLLVLHLADRLVLPRLYPWFHDCLLLAQLGCAGLIVALPRTMMPKQTHWYAIGLSLCVLMVWQGTRSVQKLRRAMAMRSVVRENTRLSGRVLDLIPKQKRTSRLAAISDSAERPPSYSGPRLDNRDVFLITIDAFRHDRLLKEIAPTMYGLSQQGIRFTRAYTQVPHTSFAVATLLTGKPVYALMQLGHDAGSHKTLPLILRSYRYKTAAFYPPSVFFVEHERLQALEESSYGFEYVKVEYLAGERRTQQVIDFLETEKPEHVFAWIHYLEPHEPYDEHPGGPDKHRPDRERYDGEIHFVDQQIARLTAYLAQKRPGALLVFAADHGEEFGEHGGRYHGTSLFDEQARVPLFLVDTAKQKILRGPREYSQAVGLIDVAPTLLGLLNIEPAIEMRGQNLAPWLLSEQTTLPQRAIWSEIGRRKMIVYGDHKLICDLGDDSCQVFDLKQDPAEKKNLVDQDPRRANELRGRLLSLLQEARTYEQAAQGSGSTERSLTGQMEQILSRARLGDRSALSDLFPLISMPSAEAVIQQEATQLAAQILSQSVPIHRGETDPLTRIPIELREQAGKALVGVMSQIPTEAKQKEQQRWAAILLLRLGTKHATAEQLVQELLSDEKALPAQRLSAALTRFVSAYDDSKAHDTAVRDALLVLDAAMAMDDPDQVRPLLRLLGESHSPRALGPLIHQLQSVRSRVDVVAALGQLGDRRATDALGNILLSDPYVHVRVQAAAALRQLGGPSVDHLFAEALRREQEPAVLSALAAASTHP